MALETVGEYETLVIVEDPDGVSCGFGGLIDLSGDGRCVGLDVHAAPTPSAPDAVSSVVLEMVDAVFANAPVGHLYVERFDDDPDLIGHLGLFTLEVEIPEFAHVGGRLATRLTFGVSRQEYMAWSAT